jgi:hypothetical protein
MSEINSADKAHAEYLDNVENATQKAVAVYPELFASKQDYTEEKQKRVERMYRNGYGLPISVAFESAMGYPYDVYYDLSDEPACNLESKPPEYLELITRIFDQPMPKKGDRYYSILRSTRRKLGPLRSGVELGRLKGQYSDAEAVELQTFINSRLEDIQKLLPS